MQFGAPTDTNLVNFVNAIPPQQAGAVVTLVFDLKQYQLWDKMKAIYPMVGYPGDSSAFELNLKDINTFRGTFNGNWTFSNTGAKPDGFSGNGTDLGSANGYFDTKLNWNTHTDLNNVAFGAYWTDWPDPINNGQYYGITQNPNYAAVRGLTEGRADNFINSAFVGQIFSAGNGLHAMSRINSTEITHYLNTTVNTQTANSTGKADSNFWFGAANGINSFQSYNIAFAFISEGLDVTQWGNFNTAVQKFQTTLGRQV